MKTFVFMFPVVTVLLGTASAPARSEVIDIPNLVVDVGTPFVDIAGAISGGDDITDMSAIVFSGRGGSLTSANKPSKESSSMSARDVYSAALKFVEACGSLDNAEALLRQLRNERIEVLNAETEALRKKVADLKFLLRVPEADLRSEREGRGTKQDDR